MADLDDPSVLVPGHADVARGLLPRRPPARSMTGLTADWGLKVNIYSVISTTKQRSPPKLIATIVENNISAIIISNTSDSFN